MRYDLLEEQQQLEELKKRHKAGSGYSAEISYQYEDGKGTNGKVKEEEEEEEEIPEVFECPEELKSRFPPDLLMPIFAKQHAIIERTAAFISKSSPQMEIIIKAKQAKNQQFSFLNIDDPLNPYYKFVLKLIKEKKYEPKIEEKKEPEKVDENSGSESDEDGNYLHPSLLGGGGGIGGGGGGGGNTFQQREIPEKTLPTIQYKLGEENDVYSALYKRLSTLANEHKKIDEEKLAQTMKKDSKSDEDQKQERQHMFEFFFHKSGIDYGFLSQKAIPPPPNDLPIIDRMAEYVARNGPEFEAMVRQRGDPRFAFINTNHMFYPYYMLKVAQIAYHDYTRNFENANKPQSSPSPLSSACSSPKPSSLLESFPKPPPAPPSAPPALASLSATTAPPPPPPKPVSFQIKAAQEEPPRNVQALQAAIAAKEAIEKRLKAKRDAKQEEKQGLEAEPKMEIIGPLNKSQEIVEENEKGEQVKFFIQLAAASLGAEKKIEKFVGPELPPAGYEKKFGAEKKMEKFVGPELPSMNYEKKFVGPELPSAGYEKKFVGPELPSAGYEKKFVGPDRPPADYEEILAEDAGGETSGSDSDSEPEPEFAFPDAVEVEKLQQERRAKAKAFLSQLKTEKSQSPSPKPKGRKELPTAYSRRRSRSRSRSKSKSRDSRKRKRKRSRSRSRSRSGSRSRSRRRRTHNSRN